MAEELIPHTKLRKAIIYALFFVIAAGVTIAPIIGTWHWQWVVAGSLLGLIIWLKLSSIIYPVRKALKKMVAQEEAKRKSAPPEKD